MFWAIVILSLSQLKLCVFNRPCKQNNWNETSVYQILHESAHAPVNFREAVTNRLLKSWHCKQTNWNWCSCAHKWICIGTAVSLPASMIRYNKKEFDMRWRNRLMTPFRAHIWYSSVWILQPFYFIIDLNRHLASV